MDPHFNPEPLEKTALRAGWLIDGQGGEPLADQIITIENGYIVSVEPAPTGEKAPVGMMDFSHATILPALMDAHIHLALSGTTNPEKRQAQLEHGFQQSEHLIGQHLNLHQLCGIAAVRDAGDRGGHVLTFGQRKGFPYVAATCWSWHRPGRYGGMIGRPLESQMIRNGEFAKTISGADHIKLIHSGLNSLDHFGRQTPPQFSADQLEAISKVARQTKLPMMVHANGETAVAMAIEARCHSIEHGYFMGEENLKRMVDRQIFWVPTAIPMAALTKEGVVSKAQADVAQRTLDRQLAQIAAARQLGVPMALGTDAGAVGVHHGVSVTQEMALYMDAGMSVGEAVRCATLNNARLMGLEKQGALRPGRAADMIAVKGEPSRFLVSLTRSGCVRMEAKRRR